MGTRSGELTGLLDGPLDGLALARPNEVGGQGQWLEIGLPEHLPVSVPRQNLNRNGQMLRVKHLNAIPIDEHADERGPGLEGCLLDDHSVRFVEGDNAPVIGRECGEVQALEDTERGSGRAEMFLGLQTIRG